VVPVTVVLLYTQKSAWDHTTKEVKGNGIVGGANADSDCTQCRAAVLCLRDNLERVNVKTQKVRDERCSVYSSVD